MSSAQPASGGAGGGGGDGVDLNDYLQSATEEGQAGGGAGAGAGPGPAAAAPAPPPAKRSKEHHASGGIRNAAGDDPDEVRQLREALAVAEAAAAAAKEESKRRIALAEHALSVLRKRTEPPPEWEDATDSSVLERALGRWNDGTGPGSQRLLIRVHPETAEYQSEAKKLCETLPHQYVCGLFRFQSPQQWEGYQLQKHAMERRLRRANDDGSDKDVNEQWLWHGTASTDPRVLLQSFYSVDHAYTKRKGFYGEGSYLAEKARYSNDDNYVHKRHETVGRRRLEIRELLLCRVLCGDSLNFEDRIDRDWAARKMQIPGKKRPYDSVHGGPHRPRRAGPGPNDSVMYVVYRDHRVYPAYLVQYVDLRDWLGALVAAGKNEAPQIARTLQCWPRPRVETHETRALTQVGFNAAGKYRPPGRGPVGPFTLLGLAARSRSVETVRALLGAPRFRDNINLRDRNGFTALYYAV